MIQLWIIAAVKKLELIPFFKAQKVYTLKIRKNAELVTGKISVR